LAQGLAAAGLDARTLAALPGGDARKVAIARVIRETSTVGMQWIADHLAMKSAANASQQIRRSRRENPKLRFVNGWSCQEMSPDPYSYPLTPIPTP
jgi:hypothetical protein